MLIGVDIGGTHFRMALVDDSGTIVVHERVDTKSVSDPLLALSSLRNKVDPKSCADGVVVGVPGVVDYKAGELLYAPNISPGWVDALTQRNIQDLFEVDARLVNDADLAAIGEYFYGAGQGLGSILYVTVSTGVGVGAMLEGKLLKGRLSTMELGHSFIPASQDMGVDRSKIPSVEDLASGTGLSKRARRLGLVSDNKALLKLAEDEDSEEYKLFNVFAQDLSIALANLCWITSVSDLVLGGGIAINSNLLLRLVEGHIRSIAPPYLSVTIKRAELGDDAGLTGAAGVNKAFGL
ncbi:glucokinase [Ferrithrix thermotolerans DSM 19514]|jgi:glucokinase|uniref:Glucokinase n=1 Tax=Ferrithrix thermotolerans DSM 19514 TaxID=1121881 RepID=A0A1M4WTW9_9ACTN|nr:ROK family protein [Ferrithrix thermotolerans]SHE84503.1 glucokinase [Ferrithrix thermotolerans DSM 19514]